jgi:hypothetical protein
MKVGGSIKVGLSRSLTAIHPFRCNEHLLILSLIKREINACSVGKRTRTRTNEDLAGFIIRAQDEVKTQTPQQLHS